MTDSPALGDITVTRSKSAGIVVGDNIVGKLKGKGGKNILLMSHMDTVYLKGILAKAPFRVEGNKAYGPGIADDKGGNAVHPAYAQAAQGARLPGLRHASPCSSTPTRKRAPSARAT